MGCHEGIAGDRHARLLEERESELGQHVQVVQPTLPNLHRIEADSDHRITAAVQLKEVIGHDARDANHEAFAGVDCQRRGRQTR